MPAWILLPVGATAAVAVLITWGSGSLFLGLITALVGTLAAAWWCEQMLRGVVGTIAQIAGGDRYAALPERIGRGALGDSAVAAEQMRQVLIDADALAVDHRSREAESRLARREKDWRKRKASLDATAAAVILQDYLDAQERVRAPEDRGDLV